MNSTQTISAIRECAQRIGDQRLRDELLGKIDQLSGELTANRPAFAATTSAWAASPSAAYAPGVEPPSGMFYDPPI